MKTITLKLKFLLFLFFISAASQAQEVYSTVGIIGPATPNANWETSVPMELQFQDNPHQWMLTVLLTEGGMKFRANNNWDRNWGGTDFPTGSAYQDGPDLKVPSTGYYTIYFNDISGDYHFENLNPQVFESIGIRGDATASGWGASVPMNASTDNPHLWTLENIILSDGEIKFLANENWAVKSWGGNNFPEGFADPNANNLKVQAGEYAVTFNDITGEYVFEIQNAPTYETVGIVGDATQKGWDASTPMNLVEGEDHDWLITTYLSTGAIKFRANDNWEVNWGGNDFPSGTAIVGGDNLQISEAGYYTIKFNDYTRSYSFIKESPVTYNSVGIIGSATTNGWDNSTAMGIGDDGHTWSLQNYELTSGDIKFRANNNWEVNWGGSEFPTGIADVNGENIPVVPGFYNIQFNDFTREYHFELVGNVSGGIITLNPAFPTAEEEVTITYDSKKGISSFNAPEKIYMHSAAITSGPDGENWGNVVGNWGMDDGIGEMTAVEGEPGKWQITLPSIREYYSVEEGLPVFRLGMVFRNTDGSEIGKSETDGDIFVDIDPGDYIRFSEPLAKDIFGLEGDELSINAEASTIAENIKLEINDGDGFQSVAQIMDGESISYSYLLSTSSQIQVKATATIEGNLVSAIKDLFIHVRQPNTVAELPEGLKNGINYDTGDNSKVTLVLLAPNKEFVYAVGDFNNWNIDASYQMNITPDGEKFWLEINDLEPQKEYVFQYWVDGKIKIGDPYADKIADPWSDKNIPVSVYPDPVSYDKTDYGIATVLQTGQQSYQWNFPEVAGGRPVNEDLVIYELLVRDFVESHSYDGIIEKLPYLKSLGVNAIELLPVTEFENNESWGYNPTYMFAPDKYYGSKNDLKAFIDKAHEMGMAVILDMVLNHQFGQSPMVQMYFDEQGNKPAQDSPWFNTDATHPYNVGYDMNHESEYTKSYIDDVNRYWIEEYKFDGYRFDLTKGFTQSNNPDDVGAWSAYDQSRVDILQRMSDVIWDADPTAYVIMEHLADNSEEKVLADYGIMLWGNMNHQYSEVTIGNFSENLNWAMSESRGWNNKNLVAYMESHDEERLMVRAENYGNANEDYNIKNFDTALDRVKLASAFYYPVPGPKMIWQFGELGYDYPIDFNGRTGNKPIPWSGADGLAYEEDESRMKLYGATAAIINLVNDYPDVFEEGSFSWTPTGQVRTISIDDETMNVKIIGNFGVTETTAEVIFQNTGTWYDFYSGQEFAVNELTNTIPLAPGEFHILIDKVVDFPEDGLTSNEFIFISTPTELNTTLGQPFSVEISWKDNSAGESGYLLERKSEFDDQFEVIATLAENVEYYMDVEAVDGITYEYRVKAISDSSNDSDWSNSAMIDLPLLAPENLNAILSEKRSVELHWEDISNHENIYVIERSLEHGKIRSEFEILAEVPSNSRSFTDTDLKPGMTYYYRVYAKDADEISEFSNVVSIRPADGYKDMLADMISMYPNPASTVVNIETTEHLKESMTLNVVNLQGITVKTFQFEGGVNSVQLDVSSIPNGVYIIHEAGAVSSFGKLLLVKH